MSEERIDTPTNGVQEQNTAVTDEQAPAAEGEQTPAAEGEQVPAAEGEQTPNTNELHARIAQLEKASAEHRDSWLRATADYKNFKRRVDQERAELIRSASAGLLLKLLPVMDDMSRALDSTPEEIAATPWYAGVKLIAQKLQTVLESEGVTPIAALGQDFDPNQHEAVIYEAAGDGQEGKVIAELQKGYKLRDRVLRPTMVKVGKE